MPGLSIGIEGRTHVPVGTADSAQKIAALLQRMRHRTQLWWRTGTESRLESHAAEELSKGPALVCQKPQLRLETLDALNLSPARGVAIDLLGLGTPDA